ncbi:hypothetical protein N7448_011469 [Penicillium atrosanguineum]|nr:hypothetical protein N7448_011469 [Penicillium atrosanguineum]
MIIHPIGVFVEASILCLTQPCSHCQWDRVVEQSFIPGISTASSIATRAVALAEIPRKISFASDPNSRV